MTNEELNTQLYEKMFAEQEAFKAHLLTLSPDEILNHAYEYCVREDILLVQESSDRTDKQCIALLKSKTPLADTFAKFQEQETSYMDTVQDAFESHANELARKDFLKARDEAR